MKKCIFCGDTNLSKEHIFAQWLLKELSIEAKKIRMIHTTFFGSPISQREHNFLNLVNGNVCIKCNTGWMSQLEAEIKTHVINLVYLKNIKDEFLWLNDNSLLFAKWAFKNAILLNNASNYHELIPDEHFDNLYNGKVPDNVFISISFCKNNEGIEWRQGLGFFTTFNQEKIKHPINNRRYNLTFQIKSLLIKVRFFEYFEAVEYQDEDCILVYPEFGSFGQEKSYMYDSIDEFNITGIIHIT